ncbi:hypothetical protein Taro_044516 [Colocasia esculenta]|uniref:Uncharacterized protein n=1 Tax=Colocasia esculenta TaxID=4460 RepID=A0A843WU91_COLES|nr:hypothetical protein [Colocasia esculenta]
MKKQTQMGLQKASVASSSLHDALPLRQELANDSTMPKPPERAGGSFPTSERRREEERKEKRRKRRLPGLSPRNYGRDKLGVVFLIRTRQASCRLPTSSDRLTDRQTTSRPRVTHVGVSGERDSWHIAFTPTLRTCGIQTNRQRERDTWVVSVGCHSINGFKAFRDIRQFMFLKTGATLDDGDLFIRTRMKKAGGPINEKSAAMIV